MKNVPVDEVWRIVGVLAVVGSAAILIGIGYLAYYLYSHLTWVA